MENYYSEAHAEAMSAAGPSSQGGGDQPLTEGADRSTATSIKEGTAAQTEGNGAASPLLQQVSELEAQLKEKDAKYVYLYAEFENFKKRATKERQDLVKFGWVNVARDLLEALDNLQRAVQHMPATTDSNLASGLTMVAAHFEATLTRNGVQRISTVGLQFNPDLHEAIAMTPSEEPAGRILKEHTVGYTLHGRLLRAARVDVSSGEKSAPNETGH